MDPMIDEAPPLTREDEDQLRWLSISHYVVGGLSVLCGFFPIIHLAVGIGLLTGNMGPGEPRFMGAFFVGVAAAIMAMFWGTAALAIATGRALRAKRRRTLVMIACILECFFLQPFGIILCVFTMLVLFRASVRAAFDANDPRPARF